MSELVKIKLYERKLKNFPAREKYTFQYFNDGRCIEIALFLSGNKAIEIPADQYSVFKNYCHIVGKPETETDVRFINEGEKPKASDYRASILNDKENEGGAGIQASRSRTVQNESNDDNSAEITQLEAQLKEKDEQLKEKDETLKIKESEITQLEAQLKEKDEHKKAEDDDNEEISLAPVQKLITDIKTFKPQSNEGKNFLGKISPSIAEVEKLLK